MQITKASGDSERFDANKIYNSILTTGASKQLAKDTVNLVKSKYYPGMNTKEILNIILQNLKKEPGIQQRYDLKRAIMNLGPSGFIFEEYFARILNHYNYETKLDSHIKGKRITHEIDIVAKKQKLKYMIECKYHNELGVHTRLHVAMYTYARFLDVGKFDIPWLVTNTKCVDEAIKYSKGVNLKITSWNFPKINSLRELIVKKDLYPITSLNSIDNNTKEKLFVNDIVLAKDLLHFTNKELTFKTGLNEIQINKIKKEVHDICRLDN